MAVSTSFPGAKLEALLLKSAATSSSTRVSSSSHLPGFCKSIRTRRILFQRSGVPSFAPVRSEVASSDVLVQNDEFDRAKSSNLSALEQLKTSAVDSKYFPFLFFSLLDFAID